MRKKLRRNIIATTVFAILCAGLVFGFVLDVQKEKQQEQTEEKVITTSEQFENVATSTQKIVLENKATTTEVAFAKKAIFKIAEEEYVIQVTDHTTVYDSMNNLMSAGQITFEGKNYPALGFFVTQINSLESGSGKNLMYYINGEEASLGVSTYVIKEGDIIEWKLK
jgi:type II secretory pathway pseudopilin PulG